MHSSAVLHAPCAARQQQPGRLLGSRTARRRAQAPPAAQPTAGFQKSLEEYVADGILSKEEASSFSPDQLEFIIRKRTMHTATGSGSPGQTDTGRVNGQSPVNGHSPVNGFGNSWVQGYVADGIISKEEAASFSHDQLEFMIRKRTEGSGYSAAYNEEEEQEFAEAESQQQGGDQRSLRSGTPRAMPRALSITPPKEMSGLEPASPTSGSAAESQSTELNLTWGVAAGSVALVGLAAGLYFGTRDMDKPAVVRTPQAAAKVEALKSVQQAARPVQLAAPVTAEPKAELPKPAEAKPVEPKPLEPEPVEAKVEAAKIEPAKPVVIAPPGPKVDELKSQVDELKTQMAALKSQVEALKASESATAAKAAAALAAAKVEAPKPAAAPQPAAVQTAPAPPPAVTEKPKPKAEVPKPKAEVAKAPVESDNSLYWAGAAVASLVLGGAAWNSLGKGVGGVSQEAAGVVAGSADSEPKSSWFAKNEQGGESAMQQLLDRVTPSPSPFRASLSLSPSPPRASPSRSPSPSPLRAGSASPSPAAMQKSLADLVADGTITNGEAGSFSPEQLDFVLRKRSPSPTTAAFASGSSSPAPLAGSSSPAPIAGNSSPRPMAGSSSPSPLPVGRGSASPAARPSTSPTPEPQARGSASPVSRRPPSPSIQLSAEPEHVNNADHTLNGYSNSRVQMYIADGIISQEEAASFLPDQLEFLIRKRTGDRS